MNIETKMFKEYKKYLIDNSTYISSENIFNDTPQSLADFPTVLFTENNNTENTLSTDKTEYVSSLQYKIEIYTKNKIIDGKTIPRKEITNELKYLTFNFMRLYGIHRTNCDKGEYLDLTVDRTIILGNANVNSWNGTIR